MDNKALFKLSYGLYVLTAQNAEKDNGCMINTALQITSATPFVCTISVNKQNFTHGMIVNSKKFNVSVLTNETPFDVIRHFGFQSGANVYKFSDYKDAARSENGLLYLSKYANAFLSFEVADTIDFGSHTMFKSNMVDGEVLGNTESVTYAYYQQYIKPKPQPEQKNGYRCNICGYVYEGDALPQDFICPRCKHGAGDFVRIE